MFYYWLLAQQLLLMAVKIFSVLCSLALQSCFTSDLLVFYNTQQIPNGCLTVYILPSVLMVIYKYNPLLHIDHVAWGVLDQPHIDCDMFQGENDIEQLCCVLRVLGTPSEKSWPVSLSAFYCLIYMNLTLWHYVLNFYVGSFAVQLKKNHNVLYLFMKKFTSSYSFLSVN